MDSSAQELSGLQAEKEGLQQELTALQTIHAEGLQSSAQEAASLKKVRIPSSHLLTAECMRVNAYKFAVGASSDQCVLPILSRSSECQQAVGAFLGFCASQAVPIVNVRAAL